MLTPTPAQTAQPPAATGGTLTFVVAGVAIAGKADDQAQNLETEGSIAVPG